MSRFPICVRCEFKKAFRNRWLLFSLAVGCGIAVYDAVTYVPEKARMLAASVLSYEQVAPIYSPASAYCHNLLTSGVAIGTELFFFLAPLLIALAYSWSLQDEKKSGYTNVMLTRVSRECYYSAKYVATFVAGGAVVVVPLLLSFVLTACQLPLYIPDVYDEIYIFVNFTVIFGKLFWSNPLLYMFARIGLDFVFAGIWACLVLSLSLFIRNRIALMALPFLSLIVIKTATAQIYASLGILGPQLTLLDQLRGSAVTILNYTWVTLVEMLIVALVTIIVPLLVRKRDVL